jgi:hypothetical protein
MNIYSVNNGDQIQAAVWICNTSGGLVLPNSPGARLCFEVYDYTQNKNAEGYLNAFACSSGVAGATNVCSGSGWPGSFQTAEVIQEWPCNGTCGGYAQFNAFPFYDIAEEDQYGLITSAMNGPSAEDPFSTTTYDIGSPGTPIGTACDSTSGNVCSDTGSNLKVSWVRHD